MKLLLLLLASVMAAPRVPADTVTVHDATPLIQERFRPLARGLAVSPECVPTSGNDFRIIRSGREFGDLLYSDFRGATRSIEMELFLFCNDSDGYEARDILFGKVKDGVKVNYIHDNFGNFFDSVFDGRPVFSGFADEMVRGGINLVEFAPLYRLYPTFMYPGERNHRKITVIDRSVAYTGGMNISEGSISGWGDCHLRITGPAAGSLRGAFLRNWNKTARRRDRCSLVFRVEEAPEREGKILQVVPDGADMPSHMAEDALVWVLDHARDYVWIETPYFYPPRPVVDAIKRCAGRGVDVRVIVPIEQDLPSLAPAFRTYFKECAQAGVKMIYRKPPFNHSKTFLADDYLVCIGTTNLDKISMRRNYEVNTYIYDASTAAAQKEYLLQAQEGSILIGDEEFDSWDAGEYFKRTMLWFISDFL